MTAQFPDPQFPLAPPLGYWTARVNGRSRAAAVKALTKGIDRKIDQVMHQVDTIIKGLGFERNPDPMRRLAAYLAKPETYAEAVALVQAGRLQVPYSWESQRAYLPEDFEHDWLDFQELRARAERGEFRDRK